MQSITNKLKYKLKLLMFMVSIVLSITALHQFQNPITTYADGDNAGGEGEGGGSAEDSGGASEGKCGFRMYVVDYNGNLKSKVIDLVYASPSYDRADTTTRIGGGSATERWQMPPDMPRPYFHSGTFIGNGQAVKQWMRSMNGEDQNIALLIYKYLGPEVLDLFKDQSEECYCVLEPIAWHSIYTGNSATTNTGYCYYGTFYNWMQAYSQMGLPDGGYTKQLDNNVLARCLELEYDQPNLGLSFPVTGDLVTMANLGNQGFGIQLYSNLDQSGTHTWDYIMGDTPAPAPQSNGQMNIVKNYRTEIAPGEYSDDGCFTRELTEATIMIEDEETYSVKAWKITNTLTQPSSITWESTVPGTVAEEGTVPKTVTIKKPSTTLYVLLEKTKIVEEPLEADYVLGESEITRAISLKTDDEGDNILQDKKFKWNFGSLATCPGHNHDPGCENADCTCDLTNGGTCTTNHGKKCPGGHKCTWGNWKDNTLKYSIYNTQKLNYPNILATKDGWNFETLKGNTYKRKVQSTRGIVTASVIKSTNWDYVCILMRGSDKLTLAQWQKKINITLGMKVLHPIIFKKKQVQ